MVVLRPTARLHSWLPAVRVSTPSDTALGDWYVNRIARCYEWRASSGERHAKDVRHSAQREGGHPIIDDVLRLRDEPSGLIDHDRSGRHARAFFEPVDRGNVGMIQPCEHVGFAPKPRQTVMVTGDGRRQNLDGDLTLQLRVGGAVDLPHPAFAELVLNAIGSCRPPDHAGKVADRLSRTPPGRNIQGTAVIMRSRVGPRVEERRAIRTMAVDRPAASPRRRVTSLRPGAPRPCGHDRGWLPQSTGTF
jgi:hypothetical protein